MVGRGSRRTVDLNEAPGIARLQIAVRPKSAPSRGLQRDHGSASPKALLNERLGVIWHTLDKALGLSGASPYRPALSSGRPVQPRVTRFQLFALCSVRFGFLGFTNLLITECAIQVGKREIGVKGDRLGAVCDPEIELL